MVWAHPLTFTLLTLFWSEVAINFFHKTTKFSHNNYLEDTLFKYIEVAEFYLPYIFTYSSIYCAGIPASAFVSLV